MNDPAAQTLESLRRDIDAIDAELLALVNRRADIAQRVGRVKDGEPGEPQYYRADREAQVLARIARDNPGPLSDDVLMRLYREIMSACRALEKPMRVAVLGPVGSFTQAVAFKHFGHSIEAVSQDTIEAVFGDVESGRCDYGIVPVEHSTEITISHTLGLFERSTLSICGEIESEPDNTTRFLVIGCQPVRPSGSDKTSVAFRAKDRSSALFELLSAFKKWNIKLTRIESRPPRSGLSGIVLYVDFEGHVDDPGVRTALAEIREHATLFKILGSYPRATSRGGR